MARPCPLLSTFLQGQVQQLAAAAAKRASLAAELEQYQVSCAAAERERALLTQQVQVCRGGGHKGAGRRVRQGGSPSWSLCGWICAGCFQGTVTDKMSLLKWCPLPCLCLLLPQMLEAGGAQR